MRWRSFTWFLLSVFCFVGAIYFWRLGDQWEAKKATPPVSRPTNRADEPLTAPSGRPHTQGAITLLSERRLLEHDKKSRFAYRLFNTPKSVGQLAHADHAILLENALLDTDQNSQIPIPSHLRSKGDPGSYIVQARQSLDDAFRARLKSAGAEIVSYIPNNAYLVRVSAQGADQLRADAQAVIAYEPYFKLKSSLLRLAVNQESLPENTALNVLLFADAKQSAVDSLKQLGAEIIGEDRSPFGPVVRVRPPRDSLAAVAGLPGVQIVELARRRVFANDLTRQITGVAEDSVVPNNYLDLTGTNITVNVNDTGVDTNNPDLAPRVLVGANDALGGYDLNGHGTHVAGIIASSGKQSTTVNFAEGSVNPPVDGQFRGKAPAAKVFSINVDLDFGTFGSDAALQEATARTNVLISNNSWHFAGEFDYGLGAASYDAAVRDALPEVTGSQPLLYVFPVGNGSQMNVWDDGVNDDGSGGDPDSIASPATAKNVITVGASESPRNLTNDVWKCTTIGTNSSPTCVTNKEWQPSTDSSDEIAQFSNRGNVGIGFDGDFGRFKPDVVAPGTAIISTRSSTWDTNAYYNPTNHHFGVVPDLFLNTNEMFISPLFVSDNAVQVTIELFSPVDLPIYVRQAAAPSTTNFDFVRTNIVVMPPDNGANLTPRGVDWWYGVYNNTTNAVTFTVVTDIAVTNDHGNFLQVLSNKNEALGPYYRYESGSSMAAADVSGTLALMQEFFEQRMQQTNSPALMKAMLINGARSLGDRYNFQVQSTINYQGWGLINLPNSLPGVLTNANSSASSMFVFDQNPTNALATGDRHTRFFKVKTAAQAVPLRATLVWTDPPGNPAASLKLVNNLDLIVTNLETGDVFFGNNILGGDDFNAPWDTNSLPVLDVVNNVENVYLQPDPNLGRLGTNYSVTVVGRHVNVNAVNAHTNGVVQDYALVVSSGDGQITDALTMTDGPTISTNLSTVSYLTNSFVSSPDTSGSLLLFQRSGASSPLQGLDQTALPGGLPGIITVGMTNQWHFFVVSNDLNFTNVAFVTFLPPNLAIPREGVNEFDIGNATRVEADVELYVSKDSGLTNLTPAALASADKSLGRGGTEFIVYSNALPSDLYYVGVKSEDQMAGEYGFLNIFSQLPFSSQDAQGNVTVRGLPVPTAIPDGTPAHPGVGMVFGIAAQQVQIRRVIVTNTLTHELMGDLLGNLSHNRKFTVLNNKTCVTDSTGNCFTNFTYVYEDNGEGNVPGSRQSDGPGSLKSFIGEEGLGLWLLAEIDDSPSHTGRVDNLFIQLEAQQNTNNAVDAHILPNTWFYDFVEVPLEGTNLTVCVGGNTLPVDLFIRRGDLPTQTLYDKKLTVNPPGGCLTNSIYDLPPLSPGIYYIGIYNGNNVAQDIHLTWTVDLDLAGIKPLKYNGTGPIPILDDAVTFSSVFVTNHQKIAALDVGLRVNHPRVSDLVFTLISPSGTRILLSENRGGLSTNGMGGGALTTNVFPATTSGDFNANTNQIAAGINQGTLLINYDFFDVPDTMHVYYDNNLIFNSGLIGGSGQFAIDFGPGLSTDLFVVMNEGGNSDTNTAWDYTATVVSGDFDYLTFTENTNLAKVPIKFAIPPFISTNSVGAIMLSDFELPPQDVAAPGTVGIFTVETNQVSVLNDPAFAAGGSGFLALANGRLSGTAPTTIGKNYTISYAYRGPAIVSLWRGEGNANDSIAGHNASLVQNITYTNGEVNQAFVAMPPGEPRISIPDHPDFALTNSLSLDAWVKPTGSGNVILWRGDNRPGFDPYALSMENNNFIAFEITDFNGIPDSIDTPLTLNQWSYVVGTLDNASGAMTLYVNGAVANQKTTSHRPFGPLLAGSEPSIGIANVGETLNHFPFYGQLDELSIYKRALSASEVKAIFQAGTAGKFDPSGTLPPSLAEARVSIGSDTNIILGDNNVWKSASSSFTASSAATPIVIEGLQPGMLIDSIQLIQPGSGLYYFPEESLKTLNGENAFGEWKLEILDNRAGATNPAPELVGWQLRFQFENTIPASLVLTHDNPSTNTIPPGDIAYYAVDVPTWASFATNTLVTASGPVNVLFNQLSPPTGTTPGDYFLLTQSTGGVGVPILDRTNSLPPLIPGTRYYLGIQNTNTVSVTAVIQVDFDITPLTNTVPLASTMFTNNPPRYFSYDVSSNATAVTFQLLNLSGNVDLVARKGLPVPDLGGYAFGSFSNGTNDEDIIIFTNSVPVPLSPGRWYLGVFNRDATNVNYTILATEYTNVFPTIIRLFNSIAYANTNAGPGTNIDYYRFVVSTNAVRAQFEINGASGPMSLVARRGLPLPDLTSFSLISTNPGLQDELITVFDNTGSVRLAPGDWFLGAANISGGPVTYSIKATEFFVYGTNIVITNVVVATNNFCFSWTSVPGIDYYVQGLTNLSSTNWDTISGTITASSTLTTFCIPLPSIYHFFRVVEGVSPGITPPPATITISSVSVTTNGILLRWNAPTNLTFQVQWTPAIPTNAWNTFTNIITSTTGNFSFLDDGSQSGGLGGTRFYRLKQLP